MIVLDASVIVKWFGPEVGDAAAKALLGASDALIAPELARVEGGAQFVRLGVSLPTSVARTGW